MSGAVLKMDGIRDLSQFCLLFDAPTQHERDVFLAACCCNLEAYFHFADVDAVKKSRIAVELKNDKVS